MALEARSLFLVDVHTETAFLKVVLNGIMYGRSMVGLLDTQYRMQTSISYWPNQQFYKGRIKNGVCNSKRHIVPGAHLPWLAFRVCSTQWKESRNKTGPLGSIEFKLEWP